MIDAQSSTFSPRKASARDTDHYSFWKRGVPAYVVEEYASDSNPHYDDTGHDTIDKIDFDYLFAISQVNITFQAKLAGIGD